MTNARQRKHIVALCYLCNSSSRPNVDLLLRLFTEVNVNNKCKWTSITYRAKNRIDIDGLSKLYCALILSYISYFAENLGHIYRTSKEASI